MRDFGEMAIAPMLGIELALAQNLEGQEPPPQVHMLSLDAEKCFDRISHDKVALAAIECGFPVRLAYVLVGFWGTLRRHLSAGGFLDPLQP